MSNNPVLTIGHSNHTWVGFAGLLTRHDASIVADVRSVPYSRFNPHFNRDALRSALSAIGIDYVYLGRELGGRPDDPACYESGRVCYDRVAKTDDFRRGLDRINTEAARHRVVLMCAEKDPLDCHRTLLVARALETKGVDILHILPNGSIETEMESMDRLLAKHNIERDGDMLSPRDAFVAMAVERQAQLVGFTDVQDDQ